MAVVTSDFLAGVLTNFRALFATGFEAAANLQDWTKIVMKVNSQTKTESYTWFGTVPIMEDVTHQDLKVSGLVEFDFSINNLLYKAGLEVERSALEDDRLNLVIPRLNQLSMEAARHPGELVFNLVIDNNNAYDGVAFFADTRVIGDSANIDNIRAGTGTTIAQIQTDLGTMRGIMRLFQDDRGRPMNLIPDTIMCPAELEQAFWQALNTDQSFSKNDRVMPTPGGQRSFQASGYTVVVNPYLTDVNDWYLLHTLGGEGPFIFQSRVAPVLEGITSPETESGVIRDKFIYSVRGRYAVGYGEPRHAIHVTNT